MRILSETHTLTPFLSTGAFVSCPRGFVVSGWALVRSHPSVGVSAEVVGGSGRTVSFTFNNASSVDGIPIEVQIVCVRLLVRSTKPVLRPSGTVTVEPGSVVAIEVATPAGYAASGAGLASTGIDGQPSPDVFLVAAEPTARGWRFLVENDGFERVNVQMQAWFIDKLGTGRLQARGSTRASAARRATVVTRARIGRIDRDVAPGQQTALTARCRSREAEAGLGWRLVPGVSGGGFFSPGRFHFGALNNTVTPQRVTFFPICLSQRIRR